MTAQSASSPSSPSPSSQLTPIARYMSPSKKTKLSTTIKPFKIGLFANKKQLPSTLCTPADFTSTETSSIESLINTNDHQEFQDEETITDITNLNHVQETLHRDEDEESVHDNYDIDDDEEETSKYDNLNDSDILSFKGDLDDLNDSDHSGLVMTHSSSTPKPRKPLSFDGISHSNCDTQDEYKYREALVVEVEKVVYTQAQVWGMIDESKQKIVHSIGKMADLVKINNDFYLDLNEQIRVIRERQREQGVKVDEWCDRVQQKFQTHV